MSSPVRCLGCGFEVPAGKRFCPRCLEPQPQNRKGYIAVSIGVFALMAVVWLVMRIFGK